MSSERIFEGKKRIIVSHRSHKIPWFYECNESLSKRYAFQS